MKQKDHQAERILIGFCVAAYFVSYITRINYGTVLLEIVNSEGITKMSASMAVTGSFVTYGIGQLISGWLGDRIKPRYLMFIGLMVSAGMNVCVPLFSRPAAMLVFWCINGFAQALMWPPMVRLLSDYLDQDTYKKSCVWVGWGSSAGTIFLYLFAPVCIVWKGWRSLFFLCAGCAVLFAFAWIKAIGSAEKRMQKGSAGSFTKATAGASRGDAGTENGTSLEENTSALQKTIPLPEKTAPMLAIIMLAIMMQGILRDGITTWMPSYISETFHLASSVSILTGIALPLFGIMCSQIASLINRKLIHNELRCGMAIFAPGFVAAFLLWLMPNGNAVLSVFLSALITGCMHGVNMILVSMIPPFFKKFNRVGFISGLVNSCTYVGSAISSYGIAWIADKSGWNLVILFWTIAALCGTLLCLMGIKPWKKFVRKCV